MGAQERLGSEPNLLSRLIRQVEKTVNGLVSQVGKSMLTASMGSERLSGVINDVSPQSSMGDDINNQNHHELMDNNQTDPEFFVPDEMRAEFLCYSSHFSVDNQSSLSLSSSSLLSSTHGFSSTSTTTSFVITAIKRIFQTDNNRTLSISNTTTDLWDQQHHFYENENLGTVYCNRSWDEVLCWPEIPEKHSITVPCFALLNRIAYDTSMTVTRACEEGGIWENKTDYSNCVAIQTAPETNDDWILEITTWVYFFGYCLSLSTLILAMSIFILFKELRCLRNRIHTNLMLTYISADALWLITSYLSQAGQGSCVTFILLHYFHLTNFFWMFVEGLYLYVLVVQTFTAENIKLRTYLFIGWGLPLLVVIGWSIAKWMTLAGVDNQVDPELHPPTCLWLTVNQLDWIYKSPAIFVLAANSLFLMRIMFVLITKLRSATNPETQQSRKAAKALVVLMPLLGITYVLVLTGSKQTPIYEHIRALLISTQGSMVAFLYCFLNAEVRQAVRHRWNRISSGQRFERFCQCCCCGDSCSRHDQMRNVRDWSLPRSRTESIRLYNCPPSTNCHNNQHTCFNNRQRESSDITALTQSNSLHFPATHENNTYLRQPFMLNVNGSSFEPLLLSPTLTVSTNLSTLAPTTPTSIYCVSGPDPVEEHEQDDLEDVDFIDSFEGQQEHYGV